MSTIKQSPTLKFPPLTISLSTSIIPLPLESLPEYIVISLCGWGVEKSLEETKSLSQQDGWSNLQAVRNKKVFVTDGNHYFNRSGPRLIDSAEMLAEIFHPDDFNFGHENKNFVKFC